MKISGWNQASKSPKDLEVFFCPFLEESNFRNKQFMVQYPRSYQRDKWIIGKEQNKSHTGQTDLYLKNKSNLLLWQVQSGASCFILQVRQGTAAPFSNQGLTKSQGMCIFIVHSWHVETVCLLSRKAQ